MAIPSGSRFIKPSLLLLICPHHRLASFSKILRTAWHTLRAAVRYLTAHDPLRAAGATAFFATFGLPAILIIIVHTLGLFLDRRTVGRQLTDVLRTVLGPDSVDAIRQAIRSFRALQSGWLLTVGIFVFLLAVSTTLFKIIRRSINDIWSIRPRTPVALRRLLRARAQAVAVMLLGGILFLAVHLVDSVQRQYLAGALRGAGAYAAALPGRAINVATVGLVSTVWFFAVYWVLPDGRPARKAALGGALITSALFSAGKVVLRALLTPGRLAGFYGASGAVVLVLLFVFYSALILYFGAALIRAWSEASGVPIQPRRDAVRFRVEDEG